MRAVFLLFIYESDVFSLLVLRMYNYKYISITLSLLLVEIEHLGHWIKIKLNKLGFPCSWLMYWCFLCTFNIKCLSLKTNLFYLCIRDLCICAPDCVFVSTFGNFLKIFCRNTNLVKLAKFFSNNLITYSKFH